MSEYQILTVLASFAFFYSVIASRLERTPVSGAVVYLFAGLACGSYGLKLIELDVDGEGLEYNLPPLRPARAPVQQDLAARRDRACQVTAMCASFFWSSTPRSTRTRQRRRFP